MTLSFKDIGVLILLCLFFILPASFIFFIDDGQIFGLNYNPDTKPNIVGQNIDGVLVTSGNPELKPIYDDTEIVTVELWQLPLRDVILSLITKNMAYIPPSFSKLLVLFYAALGLCLFILYRQKNKTAERSPASRREIIYQTVCKNPGINQQGIISQTGFSRGSVRHHLQTLLYRQEIVTAEFAGHAHYLAKKTNLSIQEQLLFISLAEKKSADVLFCLAKKEEAEITELAKCAEVSINTMRWRITRLEKRGLIQRRENRGGILYSLNSETRKILAGFLSELPLQQ